MSERDEFDAWFRKEQSKDYFWDYVSAFAGWQGARAQQGMPELKDILQKMIDAKLEDALGPHHLALCLKQMAHEALDLLAAPGRCFRCGHAAHHGSCVNAVPQPSGERK